MLAFSSYVKDLERLLLDAVSEAPSEDIRVKIELALDGQPGRVLRSLVSLEELRNDGVFFTSGALATQLVAPFAAENKSYRITDPACGAGDLLTACASFLPISRSLTETASAWGEQLTGIDIHESFVRATKLRLLLKAIQRGAILTDSLPNIDEVFPNIIVGDFHEHLDVIASSSHTILNPPFTLSIAPADCEWANGKVSTAALILERCVYNSPEGAEIVAILPDVLRTGSHYKKWRRHIEKRSRVRSIEIVGMFDKSTDVDVFIVRLIIGGYPKVTLGDWWSLGKAVNLQTQTIGDLFAVRVGPVVPHRDKRVGNWYPFLAARNLPRWSTINTDLSQPRRRYWGTVYQPPFVVIRRTSRPGDTYRAVGTLIVGDRPVAVENHLVILKPMSGSLQMCKELVARLKSSDVSRWLNNRIRCRHLTVPAVRGIPW